MPRKTARTAPKAIRVDLTGGPVEPKVEYIVQIRGHLTGDPADVKERIRTTLEPELRHGLLPGAESLRITTGRRDNGQ